MIYLTPINYLGSRMTPREIAFHTGIGETTVRHHVSGRREPGKRHSARYKERAVVLLKHDNPSKVKREKRAYSNFKKLVIKRWEEEC